MLIVAYLFLYVEIINTLSEIAKYVFINSTRKSSDISRARSSCVKKCNTIVIKDTKTTETVLNSQLQPFNTH